MFNDFRIKTPAVGVCQRMPQAGALRSVGGFSLFRPSAPTLYLSSTTGLSADAAAQFTTTDKAYLRILNAAQTGLAPTTGDFALAFWAYPDTLAANTIIAKGAITDGTPGYVVRQTAAGKITVLCTDGTGSRVSLLSTTAMTQSSFANFYVINFDRDGDVTIYRNGVADGNTSIAAKSGSWVNSNNFDLGSEAGSEFYNGRLDSVGVWGKILSAGERTSLYNAGAGKRYTDLDATELTSLTSWYDLSENITELAATAYDAHGNNDLTATVVQLVTATTLNGGFETVTTIPSTIIGGATLNGNFETLGGGGADVFANWAEATAGTSTVNAELVDVQEGLISCRLDVDASNSLVQVSQGSALTIGKRYKVTFYAKAASGTPSMSISDSFSAVSPITLDTNYTLYTVYAVATSTTFVVKRNSAASNSIFVDSVTLALADADFADWAETTSGSSTINAETSAPFAGTYACRMDIDAAGNAPYLSQAILTIGRRYKVTVQAKKGSAGTLSFRIGNSSSTVQTATTSYALYTEYFTATTTSLFLLLNFGPSNSLFFDNVTLESVGPTQVAGIAQGTATDGLPAARWNDQSGNGNNFTQTTLTKRPVVDADGITIQALDFDGVDDVMSNSTDLIGTGDITVYAVIKPQGWGGVSAGRIISNEQFVFKVDGNGGAGRFALISNASTTAVSANSSITLNTAYVLAATRTAAGVTNLYINGSLSGTADQSSGTPVAGSPTYIGNSAAGTRAFNGLLGDILRYGSIHSQAQITATTNSLRAKFSI